MGAALPLIALGASALGTGVGVFGAVQQGRMAQAAAEANARAAEQRARQLNDESRETQSRLREENRHRLASHRARIAASGTRFKGSNLQFLGEGARRLELRVQDYARKAHIAAQNQLYEAESSRWQGRQEASASYLKGAGTFLTGVGNFARTGVEANVWDWNKKSYQGNG